MFISTLEEDFYDITQCTYISFDKMRNSTVFITGATGLIGSLLVKTLHFVSAKRKLNIRIVALVRDFKCAYEMFDGYNIQFIEGDIRYFHKIAFNIDYIFHCAAVTSSKAMVRDPVGNIETSINGTQNILNIAIQKNIKSIVYISSMEVYGSFGNGLWEATENDLGYIDLTNPRSCYPMGKRMCECLCHCYYRQYKLPIKIVRLAQTFGAGVRFSDKRVFAQFAKSVMNKQNIILHTNGDSYGNYCYTGDTIKALLLLLLDGEDDQCYNVSNEKNTMTIKEMAELVSRNISNGVSKVIVDLPKNAQFYGYASPVKMKVKSDKLRDLGWRPTYEVQDMYKRMIQCWREEENG